MIKVAGAREVTSLVPPAYTGVALLLSWIYLLFYANTAGIEAAAPISLMSSGYIVSAVTMVATLLAIGFAPFDKSAFLTSGTTKIAVGVAMPVATVIMIASGYSQGLGMIIAGGVSTGVASGVMAQQWVVAYRRVGLKTAICSFPALMCVAVCVCLTLMYLPRLVMLGCVVVLPIVSEFMFHWVRLELLPEYEMEAGTRNNPMNFLLLLLPVALCFLATGFLDYFSAESKYTFVFYGLCALIPLGIAAVFAVVVDRKHMTVNVVVPVCVMLVAGVPVMCMFSVLPGAPFISIGELGMEVVVFIVAVVFSDFFNLGALKVYALERTCMALFNSLGWYAAEYISKTTDAVAYAQLSLMVVFLGIEVLAVCLAIAIVKAQKNVALEDGQEDKISVERAAAPRGVRIADAATGGSDDEMEDAGQPSSKASGPEATETAPQPAPAAMEDPEYRFKRVCQELCDEYDLSARELDVFTLLARGYTAARIQQELYIAAGTVNYHTRNIYTKLGVHSKQEVIELVEGKMAE